MNNTPTTTTLIASSESDIVNYELSLKPKSHNIYLDKNLFRAGLTPGEFLAKRKINHWGITEKGKEFNKTEELIRDGAEFVAQLLESKSYQGGGRYFLFATGVNRIRIIEHVNNKKQIQFWEEF